MPNPNESQHLSATATGSSRRLTRTAMILVLLAGTDGLSGWSTPQPAPHHLLSAFVPLAQAAEPPAPSGDAGNKGTASAPRVVMPAVAALLKQAEQQRRQGDLAGAAITLERALRISPPDPYLWNRLATIRLEQGQVPQARQFAARSNELAQSDSALIQDNLRIIDAPERPAPPPP